MIDTDNNTQFKSGNYSNISSANVFYFFTCGCTPSPCSQIITILYLDVFLMWGLSLKGFKLLLFYALDAREKRCWRSLKVSFSGADTLLIFSSRFLQKHKISTNTWILCLMGNTNSFEIYSCTSSAEFFYSGRFLIRVKVVSLLYTLVRGRLWQNAASIAVH